MARPATNPRKHRAPAKIRKGIETGVIAIILQGTYAGRRVVVLKPLPSGNVAVTGPYGVNGVPTTRIGQKYLQLTSTKVDISKLNLDPIKDSTFKRTESEVDGKTKKVSSEAYKAAVKEIDAVVVPAVKSIPLMDEYLKVEFNLHSYLGLKAHEIKF
eukprot:Blabericola_migrator_1__3807@NODE_2146_length_3208_cov_53_927093_g1358_i0_p2_GENE_NODE_2146_length_3208_cov_53_927093_g1358_i0NODE_2146_length_3208_cov_53_927093_g1358_i0_p2_ORF_typecomplete_len180_score38_60Ribosomal_L6e/PF01159_19/2e16_NODE_2146_length_3208_cov_53_927093_g1358_i026673137